MPDRDPVEVEAEALMDGAALMSPTWRDWDLAIELRDAIATALRTEATRAGDAMREAAAQCAVELVKQALRDYGIAEEVIAADPEIAGTTFDAIRALPLSDAPASPWPKVKPLVWEGPSFPAMPTYHARSVLGRYAYWRQGDRWKAVCPDGVDVDAPSEESARAVCQGHFQAGILSALDLFTPPAKDEQA